MRRQPDYGIDSPAIVVGELILSGLAFVAAIVLFALRTPHILALPLWGIFLVMGAYLLLNAGGMVFYSKVGKLSIRDQLLRSVSWRGDEMVLDVGCGRGLLLIGAAKRLTAGKAIGVDAWARGAVSGNRADATVRNATLEGVSERVEVRDGDARHLPFADGSFDVVVSNFVVHEMDSRADRERMLRETVRVLKPCGRVALVDFIFTGEAVRVLRECGVSDARRSPIGGRYFWASAMVSLGLVRLYQVTGSKAP